MFKKYIFGILFIGYAYFGYSNFIDLNHLNKQQSSILESAFDNDLNLSIAQIEIELEEKFEEEIGNEQEEKFLVKDCDRKQKFSFNSQILILIKQQEENFKSRKLLPKYILFHSMKIFPFKF